jgi:hypothetical protein
MGKRSKKIQFLQTPHKANNPLWIYCAIIAAVGIVVYGLTLFNGFVWDDVYQTVGFSKWNVFQNLGYFFFGKIQDFNYRPLFFSYMYLLYHTVGAVPFVFHFLQVSLHIANAILVFLLFSYFFSSFGALLLSLFFLVLPINVEAVVFAFAVEDIWFFCFGLLALLLVKKTTSYKKWLLPSLLLLFSLLMKENGILFLIMIWVFVFLFKKAGRFKTVLFTLLSFAVYGFLRFAIAHVFTSESRFAPIMKLPFWTRMLSVPKMISYYFLTTLFPIHLAISQKWTVTQFSLRDFFIPVLIDLVFVVILGISLWWLYKYHREKVKIFIFFGIWFGIGLGAHLQILPLDMTVADRWFYFPLVGLLGMLGVVVSCFNFSKTVRFAALTAVFGLLTVYSIRSIARVRDWRDQLTLYSHDIVYSTNSNDLENNYGVELVKLFQLDEAKKHFLRSIEIEPNSDHNHYNLALLYFKQNNLPEAEAEAQLANSLKPDDMKIHELLAGIYFKIQPLDQAILFIEQELTRFPQSLNLYKYLIVAYYQEKNWNKAAEAAYRLYDFEPTPEHKQLYEQVSNHEPINIQ